MLFHVCCVTMKTLMDSLTPKNFSDVPAWQNAAQAWRIIVNPAWDFPAIRDLLTAGKESPAAVLLQQGRERVVKVACDCGGKPCEVVVKTYRAPGRLREFFEKKDKGSKAFRAFRAAWILENSDVGTPSPVAVAERRDAKGHLLESRLITEFVPAMTDFRVEMNRLLSGEGIEDPATEIAGLMQLVAKECRRFHDCGIVHHDLGNQNIGLQKDASGMWRVLFLDLDRVRIFPAGSLTWYQRGRDLARLFLPSELRWFFCNMYSGEPARRGTAFRRGLERELRAWNFHSKTRILRHPIQGFRRYLMMKRNNGYGESPLEGIGAWVWDEKTGQAIVLHDKKSSRKFRPMSNLFRSLKGFLQNGNALRKNYRVAQARSFADAVDFSQTFGMALEAEPATWERQLHWLGELEASAQAKLPVLLRFYHHKGREHWKFVAEKAQELHTRGNAVAFALVQDRAAIRDAESWREMVLFAVGKTHAFADFYEVGHATNRSKWGVWDFKDYAKLLAPAIEAKKKFPEIKLTGPACIDFDLHNLPGILSVVPTGTFHALSQHLYVDRRGAPENFQGKFDTVGKCAVHRAAAKTFGFAEEKIIISEVNWPLKGVETYSPCAAFFCEPGEPKWFPPNVSEEDYAKFMARYWLLTIASGHVSRIYWWRLVHRGFGLIDDSDADNWRPMSAFLTLKTMLGKLSGARFERCLPDAEPGTRIFEFSRGDGSYFRVIWNINSFPKFEEITR